jgi:hypothetical protein
MNLFLFTLVTYFGVTMAVYCYCDSGWKDTETYCPKGGFDDFSSTCDVGPTDGGPKGVNCARLKKIYNGCKNTTCAINSGSANFVKKCGKKGLTGELPKQSEGDRGSLTL